MSPTVKRFFQSRHHIQRLRRIGTLKLFVVLCRDCVVSAEAQL